MDRLDEFFKEGTETRPITLNQLARKRSERLKKNLPPALRSPYKTRVLDTSIGLGKDEIQLSTYAFLSENKR